MNHPRGLVQCFPVARLVVALLLPAGSGMCQMVYSISVYNNVEASSDFTTLYGVSTVTDNSNFGTGCAHSEYETTATLINPNSGQAANTEGGLVSNTSTLINGAFGNYYLVGTVQFFCSCAERLVGGGGPATMVGVGVSATNYDFESSTGPTPPKFILTCTYSPADCNVRPTCDIGVVYDNNASQCYKYYLQQYGSIIWSNGYRTCYPSPYIPPDYFSRGQNVRAPCN